MDRMNPAEILKRTFWKIYHRYIFAIKGGGSNRKRKIHWLLTTWGAENTQCVSASCISVPHGILISGFWKAQEQHNCKSNAKAADSLKSGWLEDAGTFTLTFSIQPQFTVLRDHFASAFCALLQYWHCIHLIVRFFFLMNCMNLEKKGTLEFFFFY